VRTHGEEDGTMGNHTTRRHFTALTQARPAQADLSWLESLLSIFDPSGKSVRVQK
jgi:hypothetical protein